MPSSDNATRRLDLLNQISRGAVLRLPSGETREYDPLGTYAVVNGPVGEFETAGWARVGGVVTDGPYRHPTQRARRWQLTREGEQVVARAVREREACPWCESAGEPGRQCRCAFRCGYGGCGSYTREV